MAGSLRTVACNGDAAVSDSNIFGMLAVPVNTTPETVLDGITDHDARLIADLVSNIRPPAEVLTQYGLTAQDFAAKAKNPQWAAAFRETKRVWASDMNMQTRIRLKAAFLLEDSLLPLFRIIKAENMPVSARLEAIDQLTKISTITNVPKDVGTGEKHSITINIGAGMPPTVITAQESGNDRIIDAR